MNDCGYNCENCGKGFDDFEGWGWHAGTCYPPDYDRDRYISFEAVT